MPGDCCFNDRWMQEADYCTWVCRTGKNKARCRLCLKDTDIMGESGLNSHARSDKHKQIAESSSSVPVSSFLPGSEHTKDACLFIAE